MLEQAGYRVAAQLPAGETPAVVLTPETGGPANDVAAPVVRLRRRKSAKAGDDSIYRYDREGLLAALEARLAGAGGR
jgi:two-component system chemotaxis sensor kinase CheA